MFNAFIAAGAISKANANDPKKSALVRCARTDKGVHAAGNVISLKLIVEDEDIVQRINAHLSPQIRVWGIEQTTGSFSAYQACDSRIYEYLIPTHCFVPPHPRSFLGKKLVELAEEAGDMEGYRSRQEDALSFWEEAEEKFVKPVLDELGPELGQQALQAIFDSSATQLAEEDEKEKSRPETSGGSQNGNHQQSPSAQTSTKHAEDAMDVDPAPKIVADTASEHQTSQTNGDTSTPNQASDQPGTTLDNPAPPQLSTDPNPDPLPSTTTTTATNPLDPAIRALKTAYLKAKHAYRVPPQRLTRLSSLLSRYVGTHRFHNYTIGKSARDASCKRHIKSFVVDRAVWSARGGAPGFV